MDTAVERLDLFTNCEHIMPTRADDRRLLRDTRVLISGSCDKDGSDGPRGVFGELLLPIMHVEHPMNRDEVGSRKSHSRRIRLLGIIWT